MIGFVKLMISDFHQPKEFKIKIFKLTKTLRQKGFGNDLDNKCDFTRIFKFCLENNIKKGSIVLFDTKGAHRGGMVLKGRGKL